MAAITQSNVRSDVIHALIAKRLAELILLTQQTLTKQTIIADAQVQLAAEYGIDIDTDPKLGND